MIEDLNQGIKATKSAVETTPDGQPGLTVYQFSLSKKLGIRYIWTREMEVLDQAILTLDGAMEIIPHGHVNLPGGLNNLADFLGSRFEKIASRLERRS